MPSSTAVSRAHVRSRRTTFTCFKRLPPELREMVWKEALTEYTVLFLPSTGASISSVTHLPRFSNVRRLGFNPASIALVDREAAECWRRFHRLVQLPKCPNLIRLHPNINLTMLLLEGGIVDLGQLLWNAIPQHKLSLVAIKENKNDSVLNSLSWNHPLMGQNGLAIEGSNGVKKWGHMERLLYVRKKKGRTVAGSAKALIKTARDELPVADFKSKHEPGPTWFEEILRTS